MTRVRVEGFTISLDVGGTDLHQWLIPVHKLRKLLVDLSEDYERIYIDTPPLLNFYTFSALVAADRLLIPFDCDSFSRQALYRVIAQVEDLRCDHNESLKVEGVVVNQFTGHTGLHQSLVVGLLDALERAA